MVTFSMAGQSSLRDCAVRFLLLAGAILMPGSLLAQSQQRPADPSATQAAASLDDLPDAPQAANQTPASAPQTSQTNSSSATQTPSSSSSQTAPKTAETKEQQRERAARELKQEEQQRMLGVVPLFNVTSNHNAAPLTPKEKYQLFLKGSTDWYVFLETAVDGGLSMDGDEYASYGQGVEGFAKYWGAAYADTFDGNFWGNAVLPSWWHEDPRYFRMGKGNNFFKRVGYSALTTVWCKRDSGKWGPNYGNVAGNFIAGGISNLYYPKNDRGVELSLGRGASVTYEGAVGAEIAEFWPDIAEHLFNKNRPRKEHKSKHGKPPATTPAQTAPSAPSSPAAAPGPSSSH